MGWAYQSWPVDYSTSAYIIWGVLWLWGVEKLKQCGVHILLVSNFNETTSEARRDIRYQNKALLGLWGKCCADQKTKRLGCLRVWRRDRAKELSEAEPKATRELFSICSGLRWTCYGTCADSYTPSAAVTDGPERVESPQEAWGGSVRGPAQSPVDAGLTRDPGPSSRSSPTLSFRLLLQPPEWDQLEVLCMSGENHLMIRLLCPDPELRDSSVNSTATTCSRAFLGKTLVLEMPFQDLSCHSICLDISKSFRKH